MAWRNPPKICVHGLEFRVLGLRVVLGLRFRVVGSLTTSRKFPLH